MMKCPWYNNEMEFGYIQSYDGDVFYTQEKRLFGGARESDIVLNKNFITSPRVEACICKKCKKIVIDY